MSSITRKLFLISQNYSFVYVKKHVTGKEVKSVKNATISVNNCVLNYSG